MVENQHHAHPFIYVECQSIQIELYTLEVTYLKNMIYIVKTAKIKEISLLS